MGKENTRLPRVAAIHDLSCFGRCALTVILPTLSVMELQAVPIPTALLSTHTGGFSGMSFLELDREMKKTAEHFDRIGLCFDAIYTGFLGSAEQIATVSEFIERFGKGGCKILVDPVMGDDGSLYSTYTDELMLGMSRLCERADIITPNLTEACFLTDIEYKKTVDMKKNEAEEYAVGLCLELKKRFSAEIVLTGLHCRDSKILTCGMNDEGFFSHEVEHIGRNYPGTGDFFASVLLGRLINGHELKAAAAYASELTRRAVELAEEEGEPVRNGVPFERLLKELSR